VSRVNVGVQADEGDQRGKAPIQLLYLNFKQATGKGTGRKSLATHCNIHTTIDQGPVSIRFNQL